MRLREDRLRSAAATPPRLHEAVCVYEQCQAVAEPGLPVDIYLCRPHFERIGQMYVVTSDRVKIVVEDEYQAFHVTDTQVDMVAKMKKMEVIRAREEHRKNEAELEARNKTGLAPTSVVYYIAFGDRVKIGTSTNLKSRLMVVPHDEVLATEPGDHRLENQRHRQFRDSRLIGEWFSPTADLLAHIDSIKPRLVGQ